VTVQWRDCLARLLEILPSRLKTKKDFQVLMGGLIGRGLLSIDDINYILLGEK